MKNASIFKLVLSLLVLSSLSFQSCIEDRCSMTIRYMEYQPVYMPVDEFRNAVQVEGPRDLQNPGKMFVKGDYLFVNEIAKGVHIIDNSNPANPANVAFLNIPGNYDISASCDVLYTDSSIDLLAFDISNPSSPILVNRIANALPHMIYYRGYEADPNQGIVVDWIGEEVVGEYDDCANGMPDIWVMNQIPTNEPILDNNTIGNTRGTASPTPGKAGSMARFAVQSDHLYILSTTDLSVFNVQDCANPVSLGKIEMNAWGNELETIFPFENMLLIGSQAGMFLYDNSMPSNPTFLSVFEHVTACDPVVAEGNYAYVTLHTDSNSPCNGFTNQLDVIDISNPAVPRLMETYGMSKPMGVGIDKGTLFVCDSEAGLRVYDASNPNNLQEQAHFRNMRAYDVIPNEGVAIMVGADGIAQYDYTNPTNLELLSTIPVR